MKKTRRKLLLGGLAAGCTAWLPTKALAAETLLTLAHGAAEDNPRHQAALRFAELLAKSSNGRLRVEIAPASKMGDDAAMLAAVREGRIDMTANSQGPVSQVVAEFSALGLPYLFATQYQVWRVLAGPVGKELGRLSSEQGLVVLGLWDNGFRHMTNNKHPINEPADLKGLKMRVPADPATQALMKVLGAQPETIKFSELPAALKEGRVDGQENPLINIYSAKLYEVQTYLSFTNHKYETTPFLMGKKSWDRLSAADHQLILDAAQEATQFQREAMLKSEERLFYRLRSAGMKLNYVKVAPFVQASLPVQQAWLAGATASFTRLLVDAAAAAADRGANRP